MQDSWGQNFRTKDGRQVALTGCSRSSESITDTMDRRQGSDRPRSARTDENIDHVNDMVLSQEDQLRTHSTVREISRKKDICCPHHTKGSAAEMLLRGDVRESWLRRTALLVSYFWSFPSLPRTSSSLQMKRCSLWLQRWKNCENQLRFHQVKANKIKRVLKTIV